MNITDGDRELAAQIDATFKVDINHVGIEYLANQIAAYRHRLTSQSADTIQRQKDALKAADRTILYLQCNASLTVMEQEYCASFAALIQPLLKD